MHVPAVMPEVRGGGRLTGVCAKATAAKGMARTKERMITGLEGMQKVFLARVMGLCQRQRLEWNGIELFGVDGDGR
jgi:hypothetical protein